MAAGEEELELGTTGGEEEKVFSLLKPKVYVITWLTDRAAFSRMCLILWE